MHLSRVHVAGHLHLVNALEVQKMRILHSFLRHMHLSRVHVGGYMRQVKFEGIPRGSSLFASGACCGLAVGVKRCLPPHSSHLGRRLRGDWKDTSRRMANMESATSSTQEHH